ncbi:MULTISPECIES: DUF6691 family protein [unclassified Haladaptatus]|uniref:DUF6691 family protein n=1 Tax=unclassified Haladaptatus TaxID=2622732 RepID=UPI0023E76BA6|nr:MULTISPECIES: DUF6691 family protein [unclassified Haladaptatus]
MSDERHPLFIPVIFVGGLVFGFGLALSNMAKPEVVLDFLLLDDFGLLFVMGGAAIVSGLTVVLAVQFLGNAPLTGRAYTRRVKDMDRDVVVGGTVFGVGWGLSGICPGAGYASLGIGNYPILLAFIGMFVGAYLQGYWKTIRSSEQPAGG